MFLNTFTSVVDTELLNEKFKIDDGDSSVVGGISYINIDTRPYEASQARLNLEEFDQVPILYSDAENEDGGCFFKMYPLVIEDVDLTMTRPALKNQDAIRPITSVVPLDPPFEFNPPRGTDFIKRSGINTNNVGMVVQNDIPKSIFNGRYFNRPIDIDVNERGSYLNELCDCSVFYNEDTYEHMVCYAFTLTNRATGAQFTGSDDIYPRTTSALFDIGGAPWAPNYPNQYQRIRINTKDKNFYVLVEEIRVRGEEVAFQHLFRNVDLIMKLCPVSQITARFAEYPYVCALTGVSDIMCKRVISENLKFIQFFNDLTATI